MVIAREEEAAVGLVLITRSENPSPQGNQFTGLWACWRRYGLVSRYRRFVYLGEPSGLRCRVRGFSPAGRASHAAPSLPTSVVSKAIAPGSWPPKLHRSSATCAASPATSRRRRQRGQKELALLAKALRLNDRALTRRKGSYSARALSAEGKSQHGGGRTVASASSSSAQTEGVPCQLRRVLRPRKPAARELRIIHGHDTGWQFS